MPPLSPIKRRVLQLSHQFGIGHLSSNLTTAEILEKIFGSGGWGLADGVRVGNSSPDPRPEPRDPFIVLSSGHAGLALYCALEHYAGQSAAALLAQHGTQPHLDPEHGIHCTAGSLGQGITMAVGYALADRSRQVHCIISDGECAEGCVWEALAFARLHHLDNLIVHVNVNGYSALAAVDVDYLIARLKVFLPSVVIHRTDGNQLPFLHGLHAHYKVMSEEDFASLQLAPE